jgi:hypothetical protein
MREIKNQIQTKQQTLFDDVFLNPYKMPEEYKGEYKQNNGLTKFQPRKWTEKEIQWVGMFKERGLNIKQIAKCIDRDVIQVSIKIKRLGKINKTYNDPHRNDKYIANSNFLKDMEIKTVLDVFAGEKSYYLNRGLHRVVTNDKNVKFPCDYNYDALIFCCIQYAEGNKYDLVDLDPFGSSYDCFDLAIKMAKKGLIVTLGELGHKRFKRLDFVRRYYGIEKLEDFTTENLVKHIIKIGERNKKKLNPVIIKDWYNISRVYFTIEPIKITEQWDVKVKNDR